jgi:hypothetical protein
MYICRMNPLAASFSAPADPVHGTIYQIFEFVAVFSGEPALRKEPAPPGSHSAPHCSKV